MHFNGIEFLILKWTFGALFAGVTLLFLGKVAALLFLAAKAYMAQFLHMYPALEGLLKILGERGAIK